MRRERSRFGGTPDALGTPGWNVNLHYDRLLAAQVPSRAGRVLDVGTGDGFLAARLAARVDQVVGLDADADVLGRARGRFHHWGIQWRHADVMDAESAAPAFDAVVSNATLHHLPDTEAALRRLGSLVAPGGHLAVVAFVRASPPDLLWRATSGIAIWVAIRRRGKWEHTAPIVWPPRDTLTQLRRTAHRVLPGSTVRRLLYGRVLLTWQAPRQ